MVTNIDMALKKLEQCLTCRFEHYTQQLLGTVLCHLFNLHHIIALKLNYIQLSHQYSAFGRENFKT